MKKCPTCDKTFEDSMRFCQVDGTALVDDAPAFDLYATIVSSPKPQAPASEPVNELVEPAPEYVEPAAEFAAPAATEIVEPAVEFVEPEPVADMAPAEPVEIPAAAPIAEPEDVLDLPANDPLKTVFVSDAEMRDALGATAPVEEEPVMELPPVEEPVAEEYAAPELPSFSVPDVPAPSFGDAAPPPSPFSDADPVPAEPEVGTEPAEPVFDLPVPAPVFEDPEPAAPMFDEAATIIQPAVSFDPPASEPFEPPAPAPFEPPAPAPLQFDTPVAAPVAEWTPPPAPDASWQNQEIGSNTPFQPPPAGTGKLNQTLPIVSLVLGIISLCCYVSPVTGLAALITGFMGMKNVNNDPQNYGGKGLALAGMITGGIFFLLGVAYWIYIIIVVGFVGLSSLGR